MEEQPNNNTGENRPGGQGDRNRNRNRNRNKNRGRDGSPRADQPGRTPYERPEGQDENPTGIYAGENTSQTDGPPANANTDVPAAQNQPRSGQQQPRPDRPDRDRRDQPRDGQDRRTSDRDRSADRPERGSNDRPNRDRPERSGSERSGIERFSRSGRDSARPASGQFGAGRAERSEPAERPQRERSIYDRDEDNVPERQEQYEPMAIERQAGESVFEVDDQPTGGASRPPLADDSTRERLIVGISLGDFNGIGPEVILKALQYNQLNKRCTPVIYGSMRVLNRYRNLLNLKEWTLNGIQQVEEVNHRLTNVITCFSDTLPVPVAEGAEGETPPTPLPAADIQPGKVTPEAGMAAFACLSRAVEDLKAGKIHALVTAPINKHNIQSAAFAFPGHTEYLAHAFGQADNLMFLVSDVLRVGVVTGHVPLSKVRQGIHRGVIAQKLEMMTKSLKQDFGIQRPKIAVLGLNPHAGERGLLGNEETDIIAPLLTDLRQKGQLVYGPFPADGFFGTRAYRKYDAVLAMYHDQGLIPFKLLAFEEGVNVTAGMPVVRTSPDHGTAYDIAGKGVADETSMVQAIYTACDMVRRRQEYQELTANALKK